MISNCANTMGRGGQDIIGSLTYKANLHVCPVKSEPK